MQTWLFITLPREYKPHFPEYAEYFNKQLLMAKSIYGTDFTHKVFASEWLTMNPEMTFSNSEVNPSLFVYREGNEFMFDCIC